MNFKDAYKSCNDDIRGSREILDGILNGEAPKKQKFNFKPLFACAAMAIIVVCVGFLGFGPDNSPTNKPNLVATTDGISTPPSPDAAAKDTAPEKNGTTKENKDTSVPGTNDGAVSDSQSTDAESQGNSDLPNREPGNDSGENIAPNKNDDSGKDSSNSTPSLSEDAAAPSESNAAFDREKPSAESEPLDEPSAVPAPASVAPGSPQKSSGAYWGGSGGGGSSGGGSASAKGGGGGSKSSGAVSETVSLSEYFEYLGINITKSAKLPSDMTFEAKTGVTVGKSGETIVSDSFVITAFSGENPERLLSVSVSKSNPVSKSYVSGVNQPVITASGISIKAYMMAGDVSVAVSAKNITEEEILTLMNSLKK